VCGDDIEEGKYEIHHTKYDAATYYDLCIVCRSCNQVRERAARLVAEIHYHLRAMIPAIVSIGR